MPQTRQPLLSALKPDASKSAPSEQDLSQSDKVPNALQQSPSASDLQAASRKLKQPALSTAELELKSQPVVTYERELVAGEVLPLHYHRRAQLIYASMGVMTVRTLSASYVIPPQRAVWMPAGQHHLIEAKSAVSMRTLFIEPEYCQGLPEETCVLQVSPLLRELILTAVVYGSDYQADTPQARLMQVILDQIALQPVASLSLPIPTDQRVLTITQTLLQQPDNTWDLDQWAHKVGSSKRTLNRLFNAQTGMPFKDWRQQRRLLHAIELLATGESITNIALELGYDNTSAFIAMFKRSLGTTPARYQASLEPQAR